MTPDDRDTGADHAVRVMSDALARKGYEVSPLQTHSCVLATGRGHSFGPFLPYTDFVFLVDLDAHRVHEAATLESLHQRNREYGEGRMRVPRPLRYRVPNSVTFGISARPFSEEMVGAAMKSRAAVNSGEKNSVYLLDLASGLLHSQGLERDPLRYGGSWVTTVNPSNRVAGLLVPLAVELMSGAAKSAAVPSLAAAADEG